MPWASFSMLDGPGGTGCDVPVRGNQIHYKSHTLFDTVIHSSHNNISANLTTTNRNIAASSTRTVKH